MGRRKGVWTFYGRSRDKIVRFLVIFNKMQYGLYVKRWKMKISQVMYKDTISGYMHITSPKLVSESESQKGVALCSKRNKKVFIPTSREYLKILTDMYSISLAEKGFLVDMYCLLGRDNVLYVNNQYATVKDIAGYVASTDRNVRRILNQLKEKGVVKKVKISDKACYMLNPMYGCYRNFLSYRTYYVFIEEIQKFWNFTGVAYRLENIDKYYDIVSDRIREEVIICD